MLSGDKIWMATGDDKCYLLLNQANRHGLITGASGTGKTVTLKVMAEAFSQAGVPVFMADVKGDVTGMAQAGDDTENIRKRVVKFGIEDWSLRGCPCRFWDMIDGTGGLPIRVTVSQMGPIILSRLLGLTDVQEGVLNIVFRIADDRKMLLIDLKDLRSMLNYVAQRSDQFQTTYGNVTDQSVGAILRALLAIEDQGGNAFFGEPALDLADWFECDENGHGYVNVLNAVRLIKSPQVYSMFLLWMLTELFETLPEVGDLDKPKFVFFFDEAHLLFNGMPKELLDKVIQVVKLIRSKGVGVYFITQSPNDIPDAVLAQLSNRVQHGLRAYTPAEQKVVRAAAQAFRPNPKFKAEDVITELGTGEALVSFLDEEGRPMIVEKAKILPPQCLMAQASDEVIAGVLAKQSKLMAKYGEAFDRISAYEYINDITEAANRELGIETPTAAPAQPVTSLAELEADAARARATAKAAADEALKAAADVANATLEDMPAAAARAQEAAEVAKRAAAVADAVEEAYAAALARGGVSVQPALDLTDKQKKELAAKQAKEKAAEEKAQAAALKEAERQAKAEAAAREKARAAAEKERIAAQKAAQRDLERQIREQQKEAERLAKERQKQQEKMRKDLEKLAGQALKNIGRRSNNDIVRGILGSLRF
ncbi:MAG: DUF853 family protein [Eggerthellaceae bacterium]|nr:DUF853 family protein [Eggerthellaceae bacterium]